VPLTAAAPQIDVSADARSSTRYRLLLPAVNGDAADDHGPITIRDLSETGMLLEVSAAFPEARGVAIDIPGLGAVSADIVWTSGRLRGAQFVQPLSAADVRAAWAQSKVVWPQFRADSSAATAESLADDRGPANTLPVARRIQVIVVVTVALWVAMAATITAALR
jgi:hypothetical protein